MVLMYFLMFSTLSEKEWAIGNQYKLIKIIG